MRVVAEERKEPISIGVRERRSPELDTPGRLSALVRELLEYAVEANLHPLLDQMGGQFEQKLVEQGERLFASLSQRLETRIEEISTQKEQHLQQLFEDLARRLEQHLETRERQAGEKFMEASRARFTEVGAREEERLRQSAQAVAAEASARLGLELKAELARFAEQIQQSRDEAAAAVAQRAKQAEERLTVHLTRIEELGSHFSEQLQKRCSELVGDSTAILTKQMEETSRRVHQSFLRHLVSELDQKQQDLVLRAMHPLEQAAEQTLTRVRREINRMLKTVGEGISGGRDDT